MLQPACLNTSKPSSDATPHQLSILISHSSANKDPYEWRFPDSIFPFIPMRVL